MGCSCKYYSRYELIQNGTATKKQIPAQCCAFEWEILKVDKPSYISMSNQNISKSSIQEPKLTDLSLRNLILPNQLLQTGLRIPDYSHVYVEFSNKSVVLDKNK